MTGLTPMNTSKLPLDVLVIVLTALNVGCGDQKGVPMQTGSNAAARSGISEKEAIEIALREYVAKGGSGRYLSHAEKTPDNRGYVVTIEMRPSTPGGHCTVHVSLDGQITGFFPGN
jgi:hypothetical protein